MLFPSLPFLASITCFFILFYLFFPFIISCISTFLRVCFIFLPFLDFILLFNLLFFSILLTLFSLLTLSSSQPLPPSVPLPDLSFSSVSTHYLAPSPSLTVWSAVFLVTLHGLVWCEGTCSCRLTHFTAQSSLQIESSYTNLCAFFIAHYFFSLLYLHGVLCFFSFLVCLSFLLLLFYPIQ